MKVLMAIKPDYANKIFSGEKTYEFRRVIFKEPLVDSVVVYCTKPVGKIIGEFKIKKIIKDTPNNLWEITKENAGIQKNILLNILKEKIKDLLSKLKIQNYIKHQNP